MAPESALCDFFLDGREAEAMAATGRWPMDPINGTEFRSSLQPLTITAGLEKLAAATAAVTTRATSSASAGGVGATPSISHSAPTSAPTTTTASPSSAVTKYSETGLLLTLGVTFGTLLLLV